MIQSSSSSPCFFLRAFPQVFSICFMFSLLCICIMIIMSSMSLLLTTLHQVTSALLEVWSLPCITLLHLSDQIRCTDSDIRILAKCVALVLMVGVFSVLQFPGCPVFWTVFMLSILHPSITLRVISSQVLSPCGHTFCAAVYMLCLVGCSHSISIWFIVSSSVHVWHWLHSLKSCIFSQYLLIFCAPCSVL